MKFVRLRSILLGCMLLVPTARSYAGMGQSTTATLTLGTGQHVTVLATSRANTAAGLPVLIMQYATTTPFADKGRLRLEADAVWDRRFIADLEKNRYARGVLTAIAPADPNVGGDPPTTSFAFQKEGAAWHALDFAPADKQVLTETSVRAMIGRFDAALAANEVNAALLYLDAQWRGNPPALSAEQPDEPVDRIRFVTQMASMVSGIKHFELSRSIASVTIAPDGKSAAVESDLRVSGSIDGVHQQTVRHQSETIAIEGASIVFGKPAPTPPT